MILDNYIIRIYRREKTAPRMIVGIVEIVGTKMKKGFTNFDELREILQRGGVLGPPDLMWMRPLRESIVWDRELPAFIVRHTVADLDDWLVGYDAADDLRSANGIIGHAANGLLDDPSMAVVYHQAESFDTLREFLAMPELRAAMDAAGVTSEPDVSFHTGGWGKRY